MYSDDSVKFLNFTLSIRLRTIIVPVYKKNIFFGGTNMD